MPAARTPEQLRAEQQNIEGLVKNSYATQFNGVRTTVDDFQRIFTFNITGLYTNRYYDVKVNGKKPFNYCAIQESRPGNPYSKLVTRIRNVDSNGQQIASNEDSEADVPLKSNSKGELTFKFNGSIYVQSGGSEALVFDAITGNSRSGISQLNAPGNSSLGQGYYAGGILFDPNKVEFTNYRKRPFPEWTQSGFLDVIDRVTKEFIITAESGDVVPDEDGFFTYGDMRYPINLNRADVVARASIIQNYIIPQILPEPPANLTDEQKILYNLGINFDDGNVFYGSANNGENILSYAIAPVLQLNIELESTSYRPPRQTVSVPLPPTNSSASANTTAPSANTTAPSANTTAPSENVLIPDPEISPSQPVVLPPPTPPVGWSTTKPEIPASTVSQSVVSSNTVTSSRDLGVLRTTTRYGQGEGEVPLSEVSLYFDYAQTFFLDPSKLEGSQSVSLSAINLYFKSKPHPQNNQSNIVEPGVYLFLCEVEKDVPNLKRALRDSIVRKSYNEINASLNAVDFTEFSFRSPVILKTGKTYAIVINFEDPQFSLWTATQGRKLLGTNITCDGAYNFGKLFRASNYLEIDNDPATQDDILKPIPATDLKFDILALSFDQLSTSQVQIELVNEDYEFLHIKTPYSIIFGNTNIDLAFNRRQRIYQDFGNVSANVFYYKPGTLIVPKPATGTFRKLPEDERLVSIDNVKYPQSSIIYGVNTNFIGDLDTSYTIVITDGKASDSNGFVTNTCVRTIQRIINSTCMVLTSPCTFSSNAAYYKVVPCGDMETTLRNPSTLVLNNSNADEDVHFVSNGVNYINFTGGSGYANTDYIVFSGSGARRNGRATISTNSIGGITSINIVNTGYGFTSSPVALVYKQNNSLSSGSGATFNVSIGGQIKSEMFGSKAELVDILSYPINTFIPNLDFNLKGGSVNNTNINFAYFDTNQNRYTLSDSNFTTVKTQQATDITEFDAIIMSKSLEVMNRSSLIATTSEGKSSLIKFSISSSNRYESPELHEELISIYLFNNEINNDATDEHTNFGNAVARHISKKITFDKDRFAEDIRVITNSYKPNDTDIKIYSKVHNSKDEEAFDDKAWTELEIIDEDAGGRTFSSRTNKNDYVELTYGFKPYPDFSTTISGDAFVYSAVGNTTVTGVGTSFNTELANGDMIVLYDELFPTTTYGVALVANTPTATAFEISKAFTNVSLEAATLKIGKVDKPFMAFNDIHNDNVATYYSTSLNEFTTYDTFAIKIVLLSNNSYIIPRVNDIRAIGVSA